jgi:hypothetical protein
LCNTCEGSSEIKSSHKDTYNRQYQTFTYKLGESLDDSFARFESIVSILHFCGPLPYSDNERAKQLLYALNDHIWGMKITALEESADFVTLDTEKLFSKLKSNELSRKGHLNHDASLTSKAFVTSTHVGGHVANPINITDPSALEFALFSMAAASDEQYESIPDDEITLLARKFHILHRFRKERRRSLRGCFECGNIIHVITDCPKRNKLDSSNKYNYNNQNNSSDKGEGKKKSADFTTLDTEKLFSKLKSHELSRKGRLNHDASLTSKALEGSTDFATLDTEKLFSKLKFHELSRKGHPNYDASLTSKAFVTSTLVGGHVANPTNVIDSSALEFALSSMAAASDEQYESIPNDEITLLARKFHILHSFCKGRRRSLRGCFECGDTTHIIADYPK